MGGVKITVFNNCVICTSDVVHKINIISIWFVYYEHGFKNRTGERTGKGSGSRTSGPTGVGPVVEPVTS